MRTGIAAGYTIRQEPGRPTIERDTLRCGHCQFHMEMRPGVLQMEDSDTCGPDAPKRFGGRCTACWQYTCTECEKKRMTDGCDYFEKKIEEAEAKARFLRSCGL